MNGQRAGCVGPAQIVNLLQDLQQQQGMAYLFIAHDSRRSRATSAIA
jgi:ABC-type oligopeptide transport system ATPase subunit